MWPYDFTKRGIIRPERAPRSPTVWVRDMETNTTFYIVFADYRVLVGLTALHNMPWLLGDVPVRIPTVSMCFGAFTVPDFALSWDQSSYTHL
jgi:hypothetical protein